MVNLELSGNQILDLRPLLDNPGLNSGDIVYAMSNPFNCDSYDYVTSVIVEMSIRNVTFYTDC